MVVPCLSNMILQQVKQINEDRRNSFKFIMVKAKKDVPAGEGRGHKDRGVKEELDARETAL